MTPEALLAELATPQRETPHALFAAAIAQREAITPTLLAAVETYVQAAETLDSEWADGEHTLAEYALYLLAEMQEPRAFPLYLRLARLPDERSDEWLSDAHCRDIPRMLAASCGDGLPLLKASFEDQSLGQYSRWCIINAIICYTLHQGQAMTPVAAWLAEVATREARSAEHYFWEILCAIQHELLEDPLKPVLQQAFADDLIDPFYGTEAVLEAEYAKGMDYRDAELRRQYPPITNAALEAGWWIQAQNRALEPEPESDLDFDRARLSSPTPSTFIRSSIKVGRNDPCPCNSGKKYKKCCVDGGPGYLE